jgi:hypothetical protein
MCSKWDEHAQAQRKDGSDEHKTKARNSGHCYHTEGFTDALDKSQTACLENSIFGGHNESA